MFVITGGSSGIGRALAFALAARDQSVLIIGRNEHTLQKVAATSFFIDYLCADVSTREGVECIKAHLANTAPIHALVNNAGTLEPIAPMMDIQADEWHQIFKTNLDAALFLPQTFKTQLVNGRVLNISSGAAHFPIKGWAAYCASKAALSMLTRCWQLESDSIAFASVMPGIIDTAMQDIARNSDKMDPETAQFYKRLNAHNRLISVETVAAFLTWLLMDIDKESYVAQEWDIYDTSHHYAWVKPPHQVLHWDF